jgi:hypothetical protein
MLRKYLHIQTATPFKFIPFWFPPLCLPFSVDAQDKTPVTGYLEKDNKSGPISSGEFVEYSRIRSIMPPSFGVTTFSASLTNLTALPPHSHTCIHYTRKDAYWHTHLSDCINLLTYKHTTSRIPSTCSISPGSLTLLTPEVGDFAELLVLQPRSYTPGGAKVMRR